MENRATLERDSGRSVASTAIPLVVDLDGTLVNTDLLVESGLSFLRRHPLQCWKLLLWLSRGKAYVFDAASLPYNSEVLSLIEAARAEGRKVVLATASHLTLAKQVAEHLKLFDEVLATSGGTNLSAKRKRDALIERFARQGFDYAGNSRADLHVWAASRSAYIVNPELGVESRCRAIVNVAQVLRDAPKSKAYYWFKALRFHQWAKNLLIFVALLSSHRFNELPLLLNGLLAFLCFGLCASSAYVLNDLLDLADDRVHATKRRRPFAAGRLPVLHAFVAIPTLLLVAFGVAALQLPWQFTATLAGYYVLTLAYSITLKRRMMVDVIALSMLYTIRIVAGTFALHLTLTFWMLAFSIFIFLSLALVKRHAELHDARERGATNKTPGRGYYPDDLEMIASLGGASGFISVLILAMYTQEQNTAALYSHPEVIWLSVPVLLFWIGRTWMLTHRGEMNDDPVVFAIKDRISLATGVLFAGIFWLAG
jgi:4-hydroxybenzoate polyprenyltransferase